MCVVIINFSSVLNYATKHYLWPMRIITVIISLLFTLFAQGQVQLQPLSQPSQMLMMNGKTYNIQLKKLEAPSTVEFVWLKNNKFYKGNPDKIFSVTDSTGRKTIIYQQDIYENSITPLQMQSHLYGLDDGRRYRHGGDFAIGFAAGVGGSFVNIFYGWSVPILVATLNSARGVKMRDRLIYHPDLATDEYYLGGIKKKVKNRRLFSSMAGGAVGMAAGTVLLLFLNGTFK